jgi:hypothetical protein
MGLMKRWRHQASNANRSMVGVIEDVAETDDVNEVKRKGVAIELWS